MLRPIALFLAALAVPALAPAQEPELRSSDHKKLGGLVSKYFTAKRENKKPYEALASVQEELDKITRKMKDRDALSLTADLEQVLYLAEETNPRGVKLGATVERKVESDHFVDEDGKPFEIPYAVSSPKKYKASTGPYPLLLCLPGLREGKPDEPTQHIIEFWKNPDLLDQAIVVTCWLPEDTSRWAAIGDKDAPGGAGILLSVLKDVTDTFLIDRDKIFLAGREASVPAILEIGAMFHDRFAGIIGRTGDIGDTGWENFRNLPTYLAGAGEKASAFEKKIQEAGYNNTTVKPDGTEDEIWEWMQATSRASYPEHVTLYPGSPTPYRAYWVELPRGGNEDGAKVDAVIDRGSNTITVEAEGIRSVRLFYNDALLDLDKPVRVIVNKVEHETVIPRRLEDALDWIFDGRCDPGRFFVNQLNYDVDTVE